MSRFSGDLVICDIQLGLMFDGMLQMSMAMLLLLSVLSFTDIHLLLACVICLPLYTKWLLIAFRAVREAKRITNTALSPAITNISEAVRGRLVGRALGCESFFVTRHTKYIDAYLVASYTSSTLMQFNGFVTQSFSLSISTLTGFYTLLSGNVDASLAAIALTYSFMLPYFFMVVSDITMIFLSLLPAVERIFEYLPHGSTPSEGSRITESDSALLKSGWPTNGTIEFRETQMRYRSGLPLSLYGLNLTIKGGEKVGVVGRTGQMPPHGT